MNISAQIKRSVLIRGFTFNNLINDVTTSFLECGLNLFSQYVHQGKTFLVYQLSDFSESNLFLIVSCYESSTTTITVEWNLVDQFDSVTRLSTNQVGLSTGVSKSIHLMLYSISHPEIKGVIACQSDGTFCPLIYLKPLNKSHWWNTQLTPWAFIIDSTFSNLKSLPSRAIYDNNNNYSLPSFGTLSRGDVFDISPDGVLILSNTGQGYAGAFANLHQTSFNVFNKFFQPIIDNNEVKWMAINRGIAIPYSKLEVK